MLAFYEGSDANKLRSTFTFYDKAGEHTFDANVLRPYSFTLFNTGAANITFNGKIILPGASGNNPPKDLPFPRVEGFKRNDIFVFTIEQTGTPMAYIRADIELTG